MLIDIQGKQIFAFSDTHGKHRQVVVPENIETVVFAGDACDGGNTEQLGEIMLDGIRYYILPVRMQMHYQATGAPQNIDVLITHSVPKGIMDEGIWGCPLLRELVEEIVPKIHIFGHIHSCGGQSALVGKTRFYDVSVFK